ncbi:unnamed protein product [Ceratitis capitata]|uniref:(Mediterranean fruit fly) hypothetical protein n=1 Tax=Ceratitis capitata TaxID=7213 RepID=A0A811UQD3_CERCA|nr:unnamed protein product [Ceratitis capitata]
MYAPSSTATAATTTNTLLSFNDFAIPATSLPSKLLHTFANYVPMVMVSIPCLAFSPPTYTASCFLWKSTRLFTYRRCICVNVCLHACRDMYITGHEYVCLPLTFVLCI